MGKKHPVLMPDYYPEFHCLAGKCKYTCCRDWQITVTKQDYHKLRNMHTSTEVKNNIKNGIKRNHDNPKEFNYAYIKLEGDSKMCPFVTSDGLCGLQIDCGFQCLPLVCKTFPREQHSAPDAPQLACTTGCEKVVDLIMQRKESLRFITQETELITTKITNFKPLIEKSPIIAYLNEVQNICIGILQNRNYSYFHRMILLGLALKDLSEIEKQFSKEAMANWIHTKSLFVTDRDSMAKTLENIRVNPTLSFASCVKHCNLFMLDFSADMFVIFKVFKNLKITVDAEKDETFFDLDLFAEKKKKLYEHFPEFEGILENILVNHFFAAQYPFFMAQFPLMQSNMRSNIWDDYKLFCFQYSFFNFICIGYMDGEYKREDLVYLLTRCSRMIFHNQTTIRLKLLNLFKTTEVDSLGDMITLMYN